MHVLDGIYKPRNLLFGLTIGFITIGTVKSYFAVEKDQKATTGKKSLVEAWKNPSTGFWELPAPWDPTYQKLKPQLQLVPREKLNSVNNANK